MYPLAFNGRTYNGDGDAYVLEFDADNRTGYTLETSYRDRLNQAPIREGARPSSTERVFIVARNPDYTGTPKTAAEMRLDMFAAFAPHAGERVLVVRLDRFDAGSPEVYQAVDVVALDFWDTTAEDDYITGVFRAADGIWRTTASFTTLLAVPGTVEARPVVTITGGVACRRRTYAISEASGRGVAGHPVKLPIALAADSWVFDRGRSQRFDLSGWLRLDIPKGRTIEIDVFTETGDTNPYAGELDLGGLSPTSTNAAWVLNDWAVSEHLAGDGAFRPAKLGQTFNSVAYGIASEGAAGVTLAVEGGDVLPRDYDAIAIPTGRKLATAVFSVAPALSAGMDCNAFAAKLLAGAVRYQRTGAQSHANAGQVEASGGALALGDVSGAIALAIGLEPMRSVEHFTTEVDGEGNTRDVGSGYPRAAGSLAIAGTLTLTFQEALTVALVADDAALAYRNASVKNLTTGDAIRIRRVFTVGELEIDTYNKSNTVLEGRGYADIRYANQHHWFTLRAGVDNAIAEVGCSAAWSYQARYIML